MKGKLSKEVWSKQSYYDLVDDIELSPNQPGMKDLIRLSKASKSVLDLGCGSGKRLNYISRKSSHSVGIDISQTAINLAKKNFPRQEYVKGDLENLPFEDESFDLVYSFYVFEHLDSPERVLKEATRVMKRDGHIVIVTPNYGAPNRTSPPNRANRINKFLIGLMKDFVILIRSRSDLGWGHVEPIANYSKYEIDWDTTVEPYISSMVKYMETLQFHIEKFSTCFDEELPDPKIHQRVFRKLSSLKIYPFTRWGPVFYIIAKK